MDGANRFFGSFSFFTVFLFMPLNCHHIVIFKFRFTFPPMVLYFLFSDWFQYDLSINWKYVLINQFMYISISVFLQAHAFLIDWVESVLSELRNKNRNKVVIKHGVNVEGGGGKEPSEFQISLDSNAIMVAYLSNNWSSIRQFGHIVSAFEYWFSVSEDSEAFGGLFDAIGGIQRSMLFNNFRISDLLLLPTAMVDCSECSTGFGRKRARSFSITGAERNAFHPIFLRWLIAALLLLNRCHLKV